ncbi:MAG: protein kinase [Hormoscilla sp. GM7CHS1pb]|nr:protein kinase [Hormoscilla sp. GM7CHS1pb]
MLEKLGSHRQMPQLLAHFEENQQFYLVQEYIEGKELSHEITPGQQWREAETIALLREILEVLVWVQKHNAIHRDLKPANIMRRQDGKIVLIDFGAVKEIGSQILNPQGQVPSTILIGTPGYMPTEQSHGRPSFCNDIYAVGMIAIQALTGLLLTNLGKDINNEVVWRDRAPHVSDRLADIIDKMVRHHQGERVVINM